MGGRLSRFAQCSAETAAYQMVEITGSGDLLAESSSVEGMGEVATSAEAFIASRSLHGPGNEVPDILYHYTSAQGLIEILKTGKIWATNIRYLNDASEFVHAANIARRAAGTNFLSPYTKLDHYLVDDSVGLVEDDSGLVACYVCSFSSEGNMLSQWRAYCPTGGGFSIGVSGPMLDSAARDTVVKNGTSEPESWRLLRCEYDEQRQLEVFRAVLDEAHEAFKTEPRRVFRRLFCVSHAALA